MPVGAEIGSLRDRAPPRLAQRLDVLVAERGALAHSHSQERGVADDELGLGPRGGDGGAVLALGEDGVAQLDVVEGLQHGSRGWP